MMMIIITVNIVLLLIIMTLGHTAELSRHPSLAPTLIVTFKLNVRIRCPSLCVRIHSADAKRETFPVHSPPDEDVSPTGKKATSPSEGMCQVTEFMCLHS